MLPSNPALLAVRRPRIISTGWTGPTTNLTHRWPMDDANVSGTTITDVVGSLNGTASGAGVTSASGPIAQARQFDGSSYIGLASTPLASVSSAYSIGLWVYLPNITQDAADGNPRFLNFHDGTNKIDIGNITDVPGGQICFAGLPDKETASAQLSNNTWAHIAWTFDGASTYTAYVNGSSVSIQASSGFSVSTENVIGGRGSTARLLINGARLYQLVTYTKQLSSSEVTQLYNAF